MKLAAFNAVCPFEIGDKIGMRKNACAVGGRTLDVTEVGGATPQRETAIT